ncbi:hypothetical protein CYG48_19895 (plasmid) [Neorhizobium sp. SOG26]|jgi:hypothetical protein|nr:hypothetical protein CYG48_19895 [Neorhizobium sp. SOG26]
MKATAPSASNRRFKSMKSAIFSILVLMVGMTATLAFLNDPAKVASAKVYVPEVVSETTSG